MYLRSVVVCSSWNYVTIGISRLQLRCTERSTAATGVHYECAEYSGMRASVCPLMVMYMGTPWELTCVTAPPCMYVWRCSHKFTEPNYRSALRVVIPTRLTIVRSMLLGIVYKGNKPTKYPFFKPGFVMLKLCWLSNARTCAWVPLAWMKLSSAFGSCISYCCLFRVLSLTFKSKYV